MKSTPVFARDAQIFPADDGIGFCVRRVDDTLYAQPVYFLPRSHSALDETFELLLASITKGLAVEVTSEDDLTGNGR
jgi:hypothetical protein